MKKRTVTLVLAMVLTLSVVGCGSDSEAKQEEAQVVQEQEENKADTGAEQEEKDVSNENNYSDIVGKEFENDDIYVKIESTERTFGINGDYTSEYETLTTDKELTIYCDGGFEIGYIKQGATIEIEIGTFNGNPSAYYRFRNPINELPFDYIYVGSLDCDLILESSTEETEQELKTDPYDEILEMAGYDKDKTYTCDEYVELVIKIAEEMGKTYNPDLLNVVKENGGKGEGFYIDQPSATFDFTDHEKTLENTKWIMAYFEIGRSGAENITEVYIQKIDENNVGILLKSEF